ncbi:hypothetical protein ACFFX0_13690 [Citricoccus parietis]|uniref:Uncharacterized protein n=1 Tax=Citricoccus parietis TaxID=592307 RepID=A0ABV5G0J7_9MICC
MVEPGHRGPGRGPRPPHRAGPDRDGLPHGGRGHDRGEGARAATEEGGPVLLADRWGRRLLLHHHRR